MYIISIDICANYGNYFDRLNLYTSKKRQKGVYF